MSSHLSDHTLAPDHGRLPTFSSIPGSLTPTDRDFEGSLMADNLAHPYSRHRVLTINDLPDDDLLAIFDFYVFKYQDLGFTEAVFGYQYTKKIESWQSLVHVCRRWRCLVFGSPRHLNLQLHIHYELEYEQEKFAMKFLDVWPAVPLFIVAFVSDTSMDGFIALLEHGDRIRHIDIECNTFSCKVDGRIWTANLWKAMHVPFSELAALRLSNGYWSDVSVLPDSFLGGSAPCLRYIEFHTIPFPGLPKLLLSATRLVYLGLLSIPRSGYISPEAVVTCLSMLSCLETLRLEFESPQSYPDLRSRRPFPPTRSVLRALMSFSFKGLNEYLEEFVARIDAPRLYRLSTAFFNDIDFDTPELNQFINRTPTLRAYDEAHLTFHYEEVLVRLRQSHPEQSDLRMVQVIILRGVSDWQLSSLAKICTLSLHPLLTMENLYIDGTLSSPPDPEDHIENTRWLDLLLPLTTVKNLHLSWSLSPYIAPVLNELTGRRTTEVLPALQNIFLEDQPLESVQEDFAQFISARQLTNHPDAISVWYGYPWDYSEEVWPEVDDR